MVSMHSSSKALGPLSPSVGHSLQPTSEETQRALSPFSDSDTSTICADQIKRGDDSHRFRNSMASGDFSGEKSYSNSTQSHQPLAIPPSSLLRETERSFLRKDYKRSLLLVHRYFRKLKSGGFDEVQNNVAHPQTPSLDLPSTGPSDETNCIRLFPSIQIPLPNENAQETHWTFLADLTYPSIEAVCSEEEITLCQEAMATIDRLAVIGLQSWHELSLTERRQQRKKKTRKTTTPNTNINRWSLLVDIFDYYQGHTTSDESYHQTKIRGRLSVELLATVWIPFWESNGFEREALAWTIQVLHSIQSRSLSSSSTVLHPPSPTTSTKSFSKKRSIFEELWLHCVCEQLPRYLSKSPQLATKIFQIVTYRNDCTLKDKDFQELFENILAVQNETKQEDNRRESDNDLATHAIIESIDSLLESQENVAGCIDDDITLVTVNPNDHLPCHNVCISWSTIVGARHFLFQQVEGKIRIAREEGSGSSKRQNISEHIRGRRRKRGNLTLEIPSHGIDTTYNQNLALPNGVVNESLGPFSAVSWVQNALKSSLKIDRLPLQALMPVICFLKSICYRVVPSMESPNGAFGDIYAPILRLLYSSIAFSVSERPEIDADGKDEKSLLRKERMMILRKHLQQAFLSLVLFWAGWRGRRLLIRCGKAAVWASLAPLRELMEAFGPASE